MSSGKFRSVYFLMLGTMLSIVFAVGSASAFTCPVLIKGANESIAKVESIAAKVTEEREKGRALAIIELARQWNKEADADHKEAAAKKDAQLHYKAEAKAKAAKALTEMVK